MTFFNWCFDRTIGRTIQIDWWKASWANDGDGPVVFDLRWKYWWSKKWTRISGEADRKTDGNAEIPITRMHTLKVDTSKSLMEQYE